METKTVRVGERGRKYMPYSEVCMHMRISGKVMDFEVVSGRSVQLYRGDGSPFSFPITYGEAGLFLEGHGFYYHPDSKHGFYYYPDDSKLPADPSLL